MAHQVYEFVIFSLGLIAACLLFGAGYWLARLKGSAPFADAPNGNLNRTGRSAPSQVTRSRAIVTGAKLKPKAKTEQDEWERERGF